MPETSVVDRNAERISYLAKAFSSGTRVRILQLLSNGSWRVNEIADALDVTYAVASQQVVALRRLGVIAENRESLHSRYGIADHRVRLLLCAFAYLYDGEARDAALET